MRKIFKFLSYSLLYMVVSIASAYGVITISMNKASTSPSQPGSGDAETSIPAQLTAMVDNFSNEDYFDVNLQAQINTNVENIVISINGSVSNIGGLNGIIVDGNIGIELTNSNQQFNIDLNYQNEKIFLELFNNKFMIETSNILNSVTTILDLLDVQMPDLGDFNLGNLDINTILGLLSDLTETKTDDSIILDIAVPVIGSMKLTCSPTYALKEIILPESTISEGVTLSLNGNIDYPTQINIEEKDPENYINLSNILDLADNVINLINQKQLGFTCLLNYNDTQIQANIFADIENFNFKVNTIILDHSLNLIFLNNQIYLEYGNIYFKYDINNAEQINNLLQSLNIDFDFNIILDFIKNLKDGQLNQIINNLESSSESIDLSNIDLSIIEKIESQNNETKITLKEIGVLSIITTENSISSIKFYNDTLSANLNVTEFKEIDLLAEDNSYIDLANIIPSLNNLINILKSNTYSGVIELTYNDLFIPINYIIYNQNNNIYGEFKTNLYGQNLTIIYYENKIYLTISETNLYIECQNIEDIVNSISEIFGFDLDNIDTSDLKEIIKQIINPSINPKLITSINDLENGFELGLYNGLQITIKEDTEQLTFKLDYESISVNATILGQNTNYEIPQIDINKYTNIESLLPIVENVYNLIKNQNIFVDFSGSYQDVTIQGGLNYYNNSIEFTALISYKNLQANVMLYNNKFYISCEKLNLVFDLNDIDIVKTFLNDYFDINLDDILNDFTNINLNDFDKNFEDINIEELLSKISLKLTDKEILINYNNEININISINDYNISSAKITYKDIYASLKLQNHSIKFEPSGSYTDLTALLDYAKAIMGYVENKQINANATINMTENNTSINAQIIADFTSNLKLSTIISSENIDNLDISLFVEDGMLYFNYNGLLLKINNDSFNELLYILLQVMGIDPSSIPFIKDIDLDIDFSQFNPSSLEIKPEDIIKIVKMIKNFENKGNELIITLDSNLIYSNAITDDITIKLVKSGNELVGLYIENIYLNNDLSNSMNISLTFNDFTGYVGVDKNKNYIDISGSNELVKAILNMISTKDFHVAGSLDILGNLIGIDIKWNVPFDVNVKIIDGQVEAYAVVGEIPTLIGVNNDVPYKFGDTESGSGRYLYIYYKDGFIYLYRTEYIDIMFGASKRQYEKCVKISLDTFLANPMYFVQYGIGFTDSIMGAIQDAMDKATNRTEPINYGNIIKSFNVEDETNYTIMLNMAEIANNELLDTLSLTIGLSQDINSKNYISDLDFSVFMPLASVFELTISSSNTHLVDYGKEVDMTKLYDFINKYTYNEGAFWEASDGNWSLSSETLYKITFEVNGGAQVNDITSAPGNEITLPSYQDIIIDDSTGKTTRKFIGWYTSPTFEENTKFESSIMPSRDITLYAKWDENTIYYRTISFITNNNDISLDNITKLEGANIDLPTLNDKVETIENTTTTYSFGGWFEDEQFNIPFNSNIMPNRDVLLYAKWDIVKVEETRNLTIFDNDQIIYSQRIKVGTAIDLSNIEKINDTTKFYLDANYQSEYLDEFVMPNQDLVLHIRNCYTLKISSDYGNAGTIEYNLYQGEKIVLPKQDSYIIDDGTQTVQTTYTFNGYSEELSIMPNENTTITANWSVDEKFYYTVSFDLRWYLVFSCTAGSKMKESPAPIASFKVLEGTTIDLTQYAPTCKAYLTAFPVDAKTFKATSWGTSAWADYTKGGSGFTSITITENTTLYACWERV